MFPSLQSTDRAPTNRPSNRAGAGVRLTPLQLATGALLFVVLATANGAGYRYGVSDQAFYIPVMTHATDASLFPRDGALIDAEGRLMLMDEVMAGFVLATGVGLERLFLTGYVASLVILWLAAAIIGGRLYQHRWAIVALGAALTLRHRIPRTSANSLEPYFHPRMLAFALGALAVGALLHRRDKTVIALVAICSLIHITTALWFAVLLGVALAILDPVWRRLAGTAASSALVVLFGMVLIGPLRGSLTTMDAVWLQAVASKDSLFATDWPAWAWLANLAFLAVAWWAHRVRTRRGQSTREDRALVWGAAALVALFLATLPFVASAISLAVQFQISRVFWLVEFVAVIFAIGAIADAPGRRAAVTLAAVLGLFSAGRGIYIMLVERPERALFEITLVNSPWEQAMGWLAEQPVSVHVLADPGHAWKFGTSVRVSAQRDVLLEEVKDSALAIYSRDVAARYVDRVTAIGNFGEMTADKARELAMRYDLDYLVAETDLPLVEAYRNERFRIYRLR